MDILTAYAGLSIAFVIITSLFLYFIIGSKAPLLVKAVLIPIVIWFTLALYFTPEKLMGWPTPAEPPDKSIILLPIIKEPAGDSKGFIDLLVIVRYDKELHKAIVEARKNAKKIGGFMVFSRKKSRIGKKGNKSKPKDDFTVKVINPRTILKKDVD